MRLWGIGHLLPTLTQLDQSVIVHQVETIRGGRADYEVDPHAAYYPHLLARAVSVLPGPKRPGSGEPRTLEEHLRLASAPWIEVRVVSVVLSLLIVPLTFLLARRFLPSHWSLFAAALLATSLLHVAFSTQERPHGTAASFLLLAVLAALRLRERGDVSAYVLAGLAGGAALGSLHYGLFALGPIAAAIWLRERRPSRASAWWALATLALVAVFVRWLYPFHFARGDEMLHFREVEGAAAFNLSGQPLLLAKFNGGGFVTIVETLWSYDPVIFLSALFGLGVLAVRFVRRRALLEPQRRRDALVVAAFVAPYLLVTGLYDQTWERFVLALLPYAACASAYGLACIAPSAPALGAAVAGLALVPAVHFAKISSAPDTLACAAEWIRANAEPEVDHIVIVPYLDLPLLHGEAALAENSQRPWSSNWLRYQMLLAPSERVGPRYEVFIVPKPRLEAAQAIESDPIAYFREANARYVVVAVEAREESPHLTRARQALRERAELVYRITPERTDVGRSSAILQRHLENVIELPFFLLVLEAARMGPTLEIYRLG